MKLQTVLFIGVLIAAPCWAREFNKPLHTFPSSGQMIRQMAFSPDGESLAACDYETLRVWDLRDGSEKGAIQIPMVKALMYRSREELVAGTPEHFMILNAETLEYPGKYSVRQADHHSCSIFKILPHPRDDSLIVVMDSDFIFWNVQNGLPYKTLYTKNIYIGNDDFSIQFINNAMRLVTQKGFNVHLWDETEYGFTYREIVLPRVNRSPSNGWLSKNGKILEIAATSGRLESYNHLLTFDLETEKFLEDRTLEGDRRWFDSVLFSPDGNLLYEVDAIWAKIDGRRIASFPQGEYRHMAVFSPNAKKIAFSFINGDVEVWDISSLASPSGVDGYERY